MTLNPGKREIDDAQEVQLFRAALTFARQGAYKPATIAKFARRARACAVEAAELADALEVAWADEIKRRAPDA